MSTTHPETSAEKDAKLLRTAPSHVVPITAALDGARILWRFYTSRREPVEGWVREFNPGATLVRISRTNKAKDAGMWHRVMDLRCEGVLEAAKAPANSEDKASAEEIGRNRDRLGGLPDDSGELEFGDK